MARSGASGVRLRGRRRGGGSSEGSGERPGALAVIMLVVGTVMATAAASVGGSDVEHSSHEIRDSDWSNEQPSVRQVAGNEEGRKPRAATDVTWPGSTASVPFWLWRHLDTLPRRLDALESRLSRIEALIELRLDQMTEGEKNRNAKDDLWREQESRRMESSFDRLERRMAYMETRLAGAATAERVAVAAATPRLQEQLRCQQEKLEESVEGIRRALVEVLPSAVAVAVMEKWKSQSPHPTPTPNSPFHSLPLSHQSAQPFCVWAEDHISNISKEAAKILRILKEKLTDEFGLQADNFITKVGNMYSDLWQRAQTIEALLKDSLNLGNSTQRDLHEGFRTLVQQQQEQLQLLQQHNLLMQRERPGGHPPPMANRRVGSTPSHGHPVTPNHGVTGRGDWSVGDALELGLGSLELSVDTLSGTVSRRLGELGRRLDSSFRMLLLAQNLFLESCHRIQLGEPTLEARLSHVLERLLDTVSNRSQGLNQEAVDLKEAVTLQTNHILAMLEKFLNVTILAIREGNEWLSAEIVAANQNTKEEISVLSKKTVIDVIIGVNEAIKPEICSGTFSLPHDNSTYTFMNMSESRDNGGDSLWKDISAADPDSDFEFPHVAAVVKNTGPHNNHSLVALFHKTHQDGDDFSIGPINETANLQIHVHQKPIPDSMNINDFLEETIYNGPSDAKGNQSALFQSGPYLKNEEFVTTTDPNEQEQVFEHEIQSTTNTEAPTNEDRIEHKRSTDNGSVSSVLPADDFNPMELDGMNEKEHLQEIITALIELITSWDDKNNPDFSEVNPINSSTEELKVILQYIMSQADEKAGEDNPIKLNGTLEFSLQNADLVRFAKAVIKMYESQDLNLNFENLYANIQQMDKILKEQNNHENKMEFSTDQVFNHNESTIDSLYWKKISDLASKLYSKSTKSP